MRRKNNSAYAVLHMESHTQRMNTHTLPHSFNQKAILPLKVQKWKFPLVIQNNWQDLKCLLFYCWD